MKNEASSNLVGLLNQAITRELQVAIQYMLQHGIGAGKWLALTGNRPPDKQAGFVASHSQVIFPGATMKKIAVAEMKHAETIIERVVVLGAVPTTQPDPQAIGTTAQQMLEIDREEERKAIELYRQIVDVAGKEQDEVTKKLFQRILADEEKHHRVFSGLLGEVDAH
jgi:bacterioferritin